MKKGLLLVGLGVCLGLAIYHVVKKEKKDINKEILMKASAYPWVSYDIEHMEKQQRFIDELLDKLEKDDGTSKVHKSGN